MSPKVLVLFEPNNIPWINETSQSMTIDGMKLLIAGNFTNAFLDGRWENIGTLFFVLAIYDM